jgi:hypothetical protein
VAAGGDWVLDFAAVGATTIGLRHFAGSIEVRNMAAGDVLVVAGTGRITLTAPCAGTLHVRGNFELIPGSATTTITDSARWNEDQRLANVTLTDTVTANNDKTGYALSATGSAALTEGYAADGAAPTLNQMLYQIWSALSEFSITGTTITAKKLDGATTAMTFTLDSATVPTSRTRAT